MSDILKQLARAQRFGWLVRLRRDGLDYHKAHSEGFVVAASPSFVVLHVAAPTLYLDGYEVFCTADLTEVRVGFRSRRFLEEALRLRGQRPSAPARLDLSSTPTLLTSAGRLFPLLVVHRERIHRDSCWIGQVASMTEKTFVLREIDPSAKWDGQTRYRFRDITRIGFGGAYEEALALVAGLLPRRRTGLTDPRGRKMSRRRGRSTCEEAL